MQIIELKKMIGKLTVISPALNHANIILSKLSRNYGSEYLFAIYSKF